MAEITYNGQVLNFLSTHQIDFDPVMDDVSGSDYMFTRVTIVATFAITPGVAPSLPAETAAQTMARMEHMLNAPRRGLLYKVNGDSLVTMVAPGGDTTAVVLDAQNGPIAKATIERVVGTETLVCTFRVTACIVDCNENGIRPAWVSHRWTEVQEVDELAMSRRTRTGRIVVRSDILTNADQLRGLVVPPLEPDFIRQSSHYTLQADGLALSYQFVDQEVWLMPPNPAARARGWVQVTSSDSVAFYLECEQELWGGKPTDKATLLRRATQLCLAKIKAGQPVGRDGSYPMMGTYWADDYANHVRVRFRAMVQPAKARMTTAGQSWLEGFGGGFIQGVTGSSAGAAGGPAPNDQRGNKPGTSITDTLNWLKVPGEYYDGSGGRFDPGDRGTANLLLIAAALSDPCLRQTVITANAPKSSLRSVAGQTVAASIAVVATLPDEQTGLRSTSESGVYDAYDVVMRTARDEYTLAVPVGKKNAPASIIRTASAVCRLLIEWKAAKVGTPPRVPNPDLHDSNWKLVKHQYDPGQIGLSADGVSPMYRCQGLYEYVAKDASLVGLRAALPPWLDGSAATFVSVPFIFADGIANAGSTSLSTGGQPF